MILKIIYLGLVFGRLAADFCQTWCNDRHDKTLDFDTSLNDLGRDSRSQGCENARTRVIFLLHSGKKYRKHSQWLNVCGR